MLDLTAAGAREWGRAVQEKSAVPGSVRLSYIYPQMMQRATATVTIHGPRLYTRLSETLRKAPGGVLYGSSDAIHAAWLFLVRTGAVEILLTDSPPADPATSPADLLNRLSDQAREQLFDVLFVPYVSPTSDAVSFYALRWRSPADVTDLDMTSRLRAGRG